MPKMHPLLEDALALFKGGAMTQAEYDVEVARIKRDEIGIGEACSVAPAPAAPKAAITVVAVDKAAEQRRIQEVLDQARKAGRLTSHVPKPEIRPARFATSVPVMGPDGEIDHWRCLSDEEVAAKVAESVQQAAKQNASRPMPSAASFSDIPRGFELHKGVMRPIPKATAEDPVVKAVRERFKAGEFGDPKSPDAQAKARSEIARIKGDVPLTQARMVCPICKGKPDKITGKLCVCGGKGSIGIDTEGARERADRGAGCVDPLPENPESVTYTAYLTSGGCTTIHADNGTKAVKGARESLLQAANGFDRVVLDGGVMLVLHDYDTQCPACHGTRRHEGRTCVQCDHGRVHKIGGRFWFGDACGVCRGQKFTLSADGSEAKGCAACNETGRNQTPAAERAHEAGLHATMGFDANRTCGRKKCKGPECRACKDAQQGGYQRPGYVRCGECKGTGRIAGEDHDRCRGKGYFTTTEFYWIGDESSFSVTPEIRRVDLLAESLAPKRDRNVAIKIGDDTVMVGAGAVPSRKSGSILHVTGTARKKYDNARDVYGGQEIVKGRDGKRQWSNRPNQGVGFLTSVHNDRSTFSDG